MVFAVLKALNASKSNSVVFLTRVPVIILLPKTAITPAIFSSLYAAILKALSIFIRASELGYPYDT